MLSSMTSVRLDHITKRFGSTVALHDINLHIAAGELFFLLGPSGCGKSTLLRLIAGLHEPTSGRVFFNDRDVTALGTDKRNAVMCFQSYALWPHMTVLENIRFGLEIKGISKAEQQKRAEEALRLVQMEQYAARKPNQLSGGQQQRVALARALVVHPDCLLLDEPLSNLDAKLRLEMRTEIRRICRQAGLTAIYVTHDQKEALSIADRLAILSNGRIEQIGKPQDVYLRPNSKFTANFIGETNFIDGVVSRSGPGRIEVETPAGVVLSEVDPPQPVPPGTKVTISIRPEVVRLGEGGQVNVFDGVVHDTIYLGEVAQHQVSLKTTNGAALPPLKAFELNPRIIARDETQAQAKVWFDPKDVVVLTK
jgi:iron(III) transport system ATP-binding protein